MTQNTEIYAILQGEREIEFCILLKVRSLYFCNTHEPDRITEKTRRHTACFLWKPTQPRLPFCLVLWLMR